MTQPELREKVLLLIAEAVNSGARLSIACEEVERSTRTYNRWAKSFNVYMVELKYIEMPFKSTREYLFLF